ncbi:VAN3-binding protein-like [Ananas comosus]|uniref:VAN3-binding protein-like n=1 Tax=Ananas comosus TaxID=4615 RepID=A0A6P5EHK1_ANACO|nr:VAN3-binding protein-like [Ananas comosus]
MDCDMKLAVREASPEPTDLLSNSWCSSAIQVFHPKARDCSMLTLTDQKSIAEFECDRAAPLARSNHSFTVDDAEAKSTPQWKFDDLKSWIWLQKAIHPELDYDLCLRKKWVNRFKITHWNGISIKKWVTEMKQKRKETERLRRAEVHAAVSVAGIAAALAAIAAENAEPGQPSSLKETAVASAAALVAAQCAHVAEATGAKREQLNSAVNAAMTATDANNIITLTAAAATSLRGAAILRGRTGHREKIRESSPTLLYDEFDFDFGRCRASLAKGDEIRVTTPDGKCRLRFVSIVLNGDGKIILKIKKISMLTAFSAAEESIVHDLQTSSAEKPRQEEDASYAVDMTTSRGKIELKLDDYMLYKKWIATINHMLKLSTTFGRYELQSCRN